LSRRIYSVFALSLMIVAAASQAQTLTVLHIFGGPDGNNPRSGLVQGKDGYFYGTTPNGGASSVGMVFRISSSGAFTNLYSFSYPTGALPYAALVQGSDSNFYGTTISGTGNNNHGTVFRISPSGALTNLYGINTNGSDGDNPEGALVQGTDGNFYGTMGSDGDTNANRNFDGTVFRISSSGIFTNLHHFPIAGGFDGNVPLAGIIQASDGYFYGTTVYGGTNAAGTVFKISSTGTLTTIYNFSGGSDGRGPLAKLVQGTDGWFYGSTSGGTTGTVFRISSTGAFMVLHTLPPWGSDTPGAALVEGSDGWFYGAYAAGGVNNSGMVFRISSSGTFSTLYSFSGPDGAFPQGTLVRGSDGWLYGTTYWGGNSCNCGTVFKFSAPPSVPPDQISAIQLSGTNILITLPSSGANTYQLQYRNSLTSGNWTNLGGSISNMSGSQVVTNFGGALLPQRFYRFEIAP